MTDTIYGHCEVMNSCAIIYTYGRKSSCFVMTLRTLVALIIIRAKAQTASYIAISIIFVAEAWSMCFLRNSTCYALSTKSIGLISTIATIGVTG